MREPTADAPNVFLFHLVPASGSGAAALAGEILRRTRDFSLAGRPRMDPSTLQHRVLRDTGGGVAWEITFEGLDMVDEEAPAASSLDDAMFAEVASRIAGLAEIASSSTFVDLSMPPPGAGIERDPGRGGVSFSDPDEPGWEDHAASALAPGQSDILPAEITDDIERARAAVPDVSDLTPYKVGHIYTGNTDKAHLAYLKEYLRTRASRASPADRRKILAFAAFQSREGSTAAINTYDSQIVTWGTGWGGRGGLGGVMTRATASAGVRGRLGSAGVRYREKNFWDVVDLASKRVITGREPALELLRASRPLLCLLIDLARDPATRDAVTEAQLATFMRSSANIAASEAISTQALFNLVTHIKHWAPGYVTGCLEWAVPQVGPGDPSEERDRRLAVLVGRYFFGKARRSRPMWIPTWTQFQLYFGRHMKSDGLDCTADPFFAATSAPTDDPFVEHPLPGAAGALPVAPQPVIAAPAPAVGLTQAPLAGQPLLESIARGRTTLRRGARGAAVDALQKALLLAGIEVPGGADGVFGGGLEGALEAFQASAGLTADGVVGRATLTALERRLEERRLERA